MGHGVDENDTFANQLEEILARFDQRHGAHQVINAGVQGYETGQAAGMFSESLMFGPRFSFIGFCYNDVPTDTTGHFRAYRHDGVRGYGIWLRYLLTETGIGLSVQKFRQYRFARSARENEVPAGLRSGQWSPTRGGAAEQRAKRRACRRGRRRWRGRRGSSGC